MKTQVHTKTSSITYTKMLVATALASIAGATALVTAPISLKSTPMSGPVSSPVNTTSDMAFAATSTYANNTLTLNWGNRGPGTAVFPGNAQIFIFEALDANLKLIRSSITVGGVAYGNPYYGTAGTAGISYTANKFVTPTYKNFVVPTGTAFLRITLDPKNAVVETNEFNNVQLLSVK